MCISLFRPYREFTSMYLIDDNMKTLVSQRTHTVVGNLKQLTVEGIHFIPTDVFKTCGNSDSGTDSAPRA